MKKNILALAVITLSFMACRKDRTCECTVTKTGTSSTEGKVEMVQFGFPFSLADTSFEKSINETVVNEIKLKEVTKREAKHNCIDYTEPYEEKTVMSVPASSFNLSVVVTDKGEKTVNCKLK